jgi:hypothetical protein
MKGEGAIVFLLAFVIFLAVTFVYTELPPGNMISDALAIPTDVWNGVVLRTLTSAIFNGVIYGVIIWLIFTFARRSIMKPKAPSTPTS